MPEKGRREAYAVLSLGARVDGLQELYCRKGLLTEAYLTDCLCRELLREGCRQLNGLLAERFGLYAQRYLFPGEQLPLSSIPRQAPLPLSQASPCRSTYNRLPW